MRMGWDPKDPFDVKYFSDDFGDFVRTITKERPGWISKKIENYVGKEGESLVNFVGRQESLVEDLVRALTLAGEEFDEAALRATPKVNETASLDEWKDKAVFTPELIDLVRRSEQEALKRFGYDFEGAVLSA